MSSGSVVSCRKRVRAESESPDVRGSSKHQRKTCRHVSHAESITGVSNAIEKMAEAFSAVQSTPLRHQKALRLVDKDGEYSSDEEDQINALFCDDISAADTYVGIVKKEKRVRFIRKRLENILEERSLLRKKCRGEKFLDSD